MKVCVDAGHGGRDPGAVPTQRVELVEKGFTLAVALQLDEALRERGHRAILPRRRDRTLSTAARAGFANRYGADAFVSIHANAAPSPAVDGIEVFHHPGSEAGRGLALAVLGEMTAAFPDHRDRGVKAATFAVLRLTRMPAVLVECEFLTAPEQARFLGDGRSRRGLATAMARALDRWAAVRSAG